jgi:sugar diacid utilization regulator
VLNEQHSALLGREQSHRQLTEVILDDGGLDAIVDRIAGLIGRPVAVIDGEGSPLAMAKIIEVLDTEGAAPPVLQELFQTLLDLAEGGAGREPTADGRPRFRGTIGLDSGGETPSYTLPIRSGSAIVGYLVVFLGTEPLGQLDRRAVEHGATVVALELLKQRAVLETEQQLRGGFVDDLLTGAYDDEETIVRRATYLCFDFETAHRVFAIAIDRQSQARSVGGPEASEVDQLRRHLLGLTVAACGIRWPSAIATVSGDTVAVVWPEDPRGRIGPAEAARILKDEINRSLRSLTVSVGIGARCQQPGDFARSFAEARRCIEMLRAFGNGNRVLPVEELGLHRFLIRPGDEANLLDFAHLRLDPLLEHERRYSSGLLLTLTIYLDLECSLTRTAEQLTVHVNTVQYRIRRVEDLTGIKLRSPHGLMTIYLALFVASLRPDQFPELAGLDTPSLPLPADSATALVG